MPGRGKTFEANHKKHLKKVLLHVINDAGITLQFFSGEEIGNKARC